MMFYLTMEHFKNGSMLFCLCYWQINSSPFLWKLHTADVQTRHLQETVHAAYYVY